MKNMYMVSVLKYWLYLAKLKQILAFSRFFAQAQIKLIFYYTGHVFFSIHG